MYSADIEKYQHTDRWRKRQPDMHKLTPQDNGKRLAGKNVSKMSYFVSNGMKNLNSFNQSSIN